MDVDIELVLAPVDGSQAATEAVEYAIAVAERYDADLHLLYVLGEGIARGLETGDINAETVAEEHRSFTGRVRKKVDPSTNLSHSSAAGFSARRLSQTPGSVILDAAEELDADFLVVPRESPGDDPDEVLGKAALYVLEYASQPVLSI